MNRYKLSMAGINFREGVARFGGDAARYASALSRFPRDEHFQALKDAMTARDAPQAFGAAHALKGLAGNLSMNRLYAAIAPLTEALRAGNLEAADALLPQVSRDYREALSALQSAAVCQQDGKTEE